MNEFDTLKDLAVEGTLSRRGFLAAASAAGISAGLGAGMMAAPAWAQETPKKGGTLRIGMEGGSASDSMDPRTYADSIPIAFSLALTNGLIEIDWDGKAKGEILESWEVAPGAARWIFNVRKGVKFNSGKALDADDVLYSIALHTGETKSPAKGFLKQIKEMKKVNSHQIEMILEAGNADLPYVLSDYHLIVVPNGHTNWSGIDGTGAYKLEAFEPGVRVLLKNRGDYWKPNRGNFDAVEILYIVDKVARTAALQSGKVDAVQRLDARTVGLLARDPKLKVVSSKGTGNRYCFVAHCNTGPYDNKDLRLALKYGIDRQKIIDTVFAGHASVGNDHTLGPANLHFNKNVTRPYDPDKAAFHFKKAGAPSNIELQTSEGAWASAVDCAALYQEALKKAGVTINVKKVSGDGYWDNVWLKQPFSAVYWANRPTADVAFSIQFQKDSPWNDTKWTNDEFEKLLLAARPELDEGKRAQLYGRAQELIAEEGGMVCFAISDYLDGYSTKLKGNGPHPRYDLCDQRLAEVGWFA